MIIESNTFINSSALMAAVYLVDYTAANLSSLTPSIGNDNIYVESHAVYSEGNDPYSAPSFMVLDSNVPINRPQSSGSIVTPSLSVTFYDWFGHKFATDLSITVTLTLNDSKSTRSDTSITGGVISCGRKCIFNSLIITGPPGSTSWYGISVSWNIPFIPGGTRTASIVLPITLRDCQPGEYINQDICTSCLSVG
jgi:hypothetical protein